MNKRSLIFLCIFSASMLVTNIFFKPKVTQANEKPKQEMVSKPVAFGVPLSADDLKTSPIYKDSQGKDLLGTALQYDGQWLTFSWDSNLPETVYTKDQSKFEPLKVNSSVTNSNEPVLLSQNSSSLSTSELPSQGTYTVQLVTLKPFKKEAEVAPASLINGQIHLSAAHPVHSNAIVLIQTQSGDYEPVGIYLPSENNTVALKDFSQLKSHVQTHKFLASQDAEAEKFYVLNTPSQQLVFSNIGGALAEVNLPTKSDKHPNSPVYSVDFDRELSDQSSPYARFPAHTPTEVQGTEHAQNDEGYYPLLRRNMDPSLNHARYYAFNQYSDQANLTELPFKVTHFDQNKIVFESNQGHRSITKTFTVNPDSPYGIDLDMQVKGSQEPIWLTSGVPEVELISNMQNPVVKYSQKTAKKVEVNKQKLPKTTLTNEGAKPNWISNSNGFFTLLMDPQNHATKDGFRVNKVKSSTLPSRLQATSIAKKVKNTDGYEFLIPLNTQDSVIHIKAFAGPLEKTILQKAGLVTSKASNYLGAMSYNGFLNIISEPCAKFLFIFLNLFHKITHSWGLSIILLTIVLRVFLYPLNSWSIKSMRRNQEIAPEVNAIQQKYKKNPKQAQVEVMALYKKRKVNPFTGCLPMLIQMPFLIGMFSLLRSAFVLRGVPFIKGWINSLTSPDVLFTWKHSIPFFGTEFHLLPILSCIMIWVQQKLTTPTPAQGSNLTDQQKQQKLMSYFMLIFVTLLCYNLPSGLNLYFISSTLLGILQQWITNRMLDNQKGKPTLLDPRQKSLKEKKA